MRTHVETQGRPLPRGGGTTSRENREPICPSTEDMLRYLFHATDQEERSRLEQHFLVACPRCHAELEGMRLGFEISFEDEP